MRDTWAWILGGLGALVAWQVWQNQHAAPAITDTTIAPAPPARVPPARLPPQLAPVRTGVRQPIPGLPSKGEYTPAGPGYMLNAGGAAGVLTSLLTPYVEDPSAPPMPYLDSPLTPAKGAYKPAPGPQYLLNDGAALEPVEMAPVMDTGLFLAPGQTYNPDGRPMTPTTRSARRAIVALPPGKKRGYTSDGPDYILNSMFVGAAPGASPIAHNPNVAGPIVAPVMPGVFAGPAYTTPEGSMPGAPITTQPISGGSPFVTSPSPYAPINPGVTTYPTSTVPTTPIGLPTQPVGPVIYVPPVDIVAPTPVDLPPPEPVYAPPPEPVDTLVPLV